MDIAIVWDQLLGRGDWAVSNGDLLAGPALESAIACSLFSEQGWWADAYTDVPIGSGLGTLPRTPKAGGTDLLLQAQDTCQTALRWLIDDDIAVSVGVTCAWVAPTAIAIAVVVAKPDATSETFNFDWAWNEL